MTAAVFTILIDWDNNGSVFSGAPTANEDVSAYVLGVRTPLSWSFGRDSARSVSLIKSGSVDIELKNIDKRFSPDNGSSPMTGNLGPGKPVLIKAVHNSITYNLFYGYIDDFDLDPFRTQRSVTISCMDALGKFAENSATTILYESIQTGPAISAILDAVGWTGGRSIDTGATTIRWFWADKDPALEAINDIVASEGPTAIAFIDNSGNFCFRDRTHRSMRAASITSNCIFRDTGAETSTDVNFSDPANYNVGFRDLANDVQFNVDERDPNVLGPVWDTQDKFRVPASTTVNIAVSTDDPFFGALVPVQDIDYTLESGLVSSITISRTSGASTNIAITAGVTTAIIDTLQLRAYLVPVQRQYTVTSSDATSQTKYGLKTWTEEVPKWVSRNDAQAIADYIVAMRKDRLPVFEVTINSGNDNRRVQQLTRDISDRVHIVEDNTLSNHDYYIEQVSYEIGDVGEDVKVAFGCERQFEKDANATVFILDSAVLNHRIDTGLLAT